MSESKSPDKIYSKARLLAPAFLLMGSLAYGSAFATKPPAAPDIIEIDKVAHLFIFGLLGTLFFRSFRIGLLDFKRFAMSVLFVFLYGSVDELLQSTNPNRSFDLLDLLADVIGAFLAVFMYRNISGYRRILELRLWGRLPKA